MNWLFYSFQQAEKTVIYETHCSVETIKKDHLPDRVCVSLKVFELDIVPQLDASRRPITVTNGLWLFCRAAFRGVAWLNWTVDKQPTNPLNPAWTSSLSVMSIPETGRRIEQCNIYMLKHILPCQVYMQRQRHHYSKVWGQKYIFFQLCVFERSLLCSPRLHYLMKNTVL